MTRRARILSSRATYHVVIKGMDRQLLFEESKDFYKYLDLLQNYKQEYKFKVFAYCLMSNHVHLLIQHPDSTKLSQIFCALNTHYASWFNMKYDRTGSLQDGRYFSEPVDSDKYLLTVVHYIHYNPTKAGLESFPGQKYPWSSFQDYYNNELGITDTAEVLLKLGSLDNFTEFHNIPHEGDCLDIHNTRKRLPDDVARDIISTCCHCNSVTEFQKLPLADRNRYIILLHRKRLSISQINRLAGVPRGTIRKVLKKKHLYSVPKDEPASPVNQFLSEQDNENTDE